ncbi:MAG TPA: xanthine dehydrogenase family protein subunit M [Dehalococcoidia bacterium]|nr:xanthine dehydrogenase family protein subunit M [Dehalococcoidia bacterium]
MYPPSFRYYRASSVAEAIALLQREPEARLLAGGHSLLPAMKLRLAAPPALIDIGRIPELRGIRRRDDGWAIGAMTTHREIEFSDLPLLAEVAAHVADPPVRNRGTIGGSLAHADPGADYPAAVLALGATIKAVGPGGERSIPADDFFQGLFTTSLQQGEVLTEVHLPALGHGWGWAYEKFPHPASGYAVVGVAAVVQAEGGAARQVRVGITGAAQSAFRARQVEERLTGRPMDEGAVRSAIEGAFEPDQLLSDPFASADYRAALCQALCRRALLRAWQRATT